MTLFMTFLLYMHIINLFHRKCHLEVIPDYFMTLQSQSFIFQFIIMTSLPFQFNHCILRTMNSLVGKCKDIVGFLDIQSKKSCNVVSYQIGLMSLLWWEIWYLFLCKLCISVTYRVPVWIYSVVDVTHPNYPLFIIVIVSVAYKIMQNLELIFGLRSRH